MQDSTFDLSNAKYRKRNHLPHVDVPGGTYFLTWCLADALPPGYLWELERQRREMLAQIRDRYGCVSPADTRRIQKQVRKELFDELDRGHGGCELVKPELAELVTKALGFFDGQRYELFNYSVMPSHVHTMFRPDKEWPWWKIAWSWKSFTAKEANRILGRRGAFWQDDNWDVVDPLHGAFRESAAIRAEESRESGARGLAVGRGSESAGNPGQESP